MRWLFAGSVFLAVVYCLIEQAAKIAARFGDEKVAGMAALLYIFGVVPLALIVWIVIMLVVKP